MNGRNERQEEEDPMKEEEEIYRGRLRNNCYMKEEYKGRTNSNSPTRPNEGVRVATLLL